MVIKKLQDVRYNFLNLFEFQSKPPKKTNLKVMHLPLCKYDLSPYQADV